MRLKYFLLPLLVCPLFLLGGCQSQNGPEGALKNFVEYRFSTGQDKGTLISRTSGPLRQRIESMTDDELETYLNNSQYKMKRFKVNHKQCSSEEKKCFVTYTIRYDQIKGEKKLFEAEIKKIAELHDQDGSWKVADVSNVKTFYESKEAIKTGGE